jgi:hypothetical protein
VPKGKMEKPEAPLLLHFSFLALTRVRVRVAKS